jgi:serine/threonine protein kinase
MFRKEYVLTDRLLGSGAFGKVYMAVEQHTKHQVACKVVDFRQLMPGSPLCKPPDLPAPAEDVDDRAQIRMVKAWGNQQKRKDGLNKQLNKYLREVEILASISHVREQLAGRVRLTFVFSQTS